MSDFPIDSEKYTLCLQGFLPGEAETASQWLKSMGHQVVRTMSAAQMIVAGPKAGEELARQAGSKGLKLIPWDQLQQKLAEQVAGVPVPDGGGIPQVLPEVRPFMEHHGDSVRILDMQFPVKRGDAPSAKLVPHGSRFANVCLDQPFVDTLRAVALGVKHHLPVALEGETSASKTTAVLWLAHALKHPVLRFNLNGQTDTGELVGRHVPGAIEGQTSAGWRFQEGSLPRALRHGWWLLLDEMNLAEPQILERLNCVLEPPATLVLTENDGTTFGPGADVPVAEGFRMFATLNPAEYSGRSVLSPAFRDRWSVWHQAQTAGEGEYLSMMRLLVFGEHPVVRSRGVAYQAAAVPPVMSELQSLPDTERTLQRVALFHTSVAKAAGADGESPGLGRTRRERYTFTRRTLHNAMRLAHRSLLSGEADNAPHALREALHTFYVARLRDAADRRAVLQQLKLVGLD